MTFDILTLFLVVIMSSFVLGGALALVGFRRVRVLMIWAAALLLHGIAYTLFLLRGRISDLLSVLGANLLLSIVFSVFSLGVIHFYRQRLAAAWLWAPPLVLTLSFVWYLDNMDARIILGGLIYSAQVALTLWLLVRNRAVLRGRGQFIVMTGFVMVLVMFLARVLAVAGGYVELPSIFSAHQLQQASFLVAILALLLLSSGLILMVQERSEADVFHNRALLAERNEELVGYSRELEAANTKLALLSNTDPLTGLYNRRYFDQQLNAEGARARRHDHSFAVVMIDIDHFKKFNDRYGHPAGDACLIQVAGVLQSGLRRAGDVLARIGGEEFVVIVSETDAEGLAELADGLRARVLDLAIPHEDAPDAVVSLSLGCALAPSIKGLDPAAIVQQADEALYAAKQAGRNRFVLKTLALPAVCVECADAKPVQPQSIVPTASA